jgi:heat shock transcription factor 2
VKRTVSGPRSDNNTNSNTNNNLKSNTPGSSTSATPATAASSAASSHTVTDAVVENQQLKTEVSSLKERIDAMTKNIDQLTTMVQQVTLKQHNHNGDGNGGGDNDSQCSDTSLRRRRPRKVVVLNGHTSMTAYVEDNDDVPTYTHSHGGDVAMPDINEASSIGVHSLMPPAPSIPMQTSFDGSDEVRVPSDSELSDEGFVDQLFTAFEDDDGTTGAIDSVDRDLLDVLDNYKVGHNTVVSPPPAAPTTKFDDDNRPREELMKRLSDALSLLPRNIQELIVDRLVYAITSPQEIQDSLQVARALEEVITASASPAKSSPTAVPHSDDERDVTMEDGTVSADEEATPSRSSSNTPATATPPPSLPLAAATLAALLSQYNQKQAIAAAAAAASSSGSDIDEHDDEHHHDVQEAQRKSKRIADKSLLIPVHA